MAIAEQLSIASPLICTALANKIAYEQIASNKLQHKKPWTAFSQPSCGGTWAIRHMRTCHRPTGNRMIRRKRTSLIVRLVQRTVGHIESAEMNNELQTAIFSNCIFSLTTVKIIMLYIYVLREDVRASVIYTSH